MLFKPSGKGCNVPAPSIWDREIIGAHLCDTTANLTQIPLIALYYFVYDNRRKCNTETSHTGASSSWFLYQNLTKVSIM